MMKRWVAVLIAVGPAVGCMETVPYREARPVSISSASTLREREMMAVPAGLSDAEGAAYLAKKFPGPPMEPEKTQEQRDREKALADQVEYEEAVAKAPWRGWSEERIDQELRGTSIYPLYIEGAEDGKQYATMLGININIGKVRVGENVYGDQVLESAMYTEPFRENPNGSARLICSRGLMDLGMGPQLVQKWTAFGTINREWLAFGSLCAKAKAML